MGSNIMDSKTDIEEGLDIHPNQSSISSIVEDFKEVNVSSVWQCIHSKVISKIYLIYFLH